MKPIGMGPVRPDRDPETDSQTVQKSHTHEKPPEGPQNRSDLPTRPECRVEEETPHSGPLRATEGAVPEAGGSGAPGSEQPPAGSAAPILIQESNWWNDPQPVAEAVVTGSWQSAENQAVLRRAEDRKNRSVGTFRELASQRYQQEAERLANCGSWVILRQYLGGERLVSTVAAADWCNQPRLCEPCAAARAVKLQRAMLPKIMARILAGEIPVMGTLTVRDGGDLAERLNHLLTSIGQARQRRKDAQRGKSQSGFFALPSGIILAVEIKRGKNSGLWHPHAHFVAMMPEGVEIDAAALTAQLSAEWLAITGDSHVVDVRPMHASRLLEFGVPECEVLEQLAIDVQEVVKYAVKFGDMNPPDTVEAWRTCRRKRLVRSWGSLLGKVESSNDDLEPLTERWVEHLLSFNWMMNSRDGQPHSGYYVRQRSSLDGTAAGRPAGGRVVWENPQQRYAERLRLRG